MKVYVVTRGEQYEGGSVCAVYTTQEKAKAAALEQTPCFEGGWKETSENYWVNGCDYVYVEEWEVSE